MIDIIYDRSERIYKWAHPETGEIVTAPSGQKHQLFKAAVAMLDDDLYTAAVLWIDETPQLERLIWKGVDILAANKADVYPTPQNGIVAMVDSSDEYGRYAITHDANGRFTCQCMAYSEHPEYDQNGRIWCKHTAAVKLYQVSRSQF